METITIHCPNGHQLTGPANLTGRKVRCPKCSTTFVLSNTPKQSLTDTGVMRLLGDVDPVPPPPETEEAVKTQKVCPRCHHSISVHAHVCEHCKCYVGTMPTFLTQMISEGKSILGYRPQT